MTSRLTLLTLFLFTFNVNAQDLDTVVIAGRVIDQNSAVIQGADVQARLLKTGQTRTTTSDEDGRFRLVQLEPGTYAVTVSIDGFASMRMTGIVAVSGQNIELPITLIPGNIEVAPVVVVAADVPGVDTKRTVTGATLATRELESLPSPTRSVLDLIFTLPGVTEESLSTRDLAEDRNVFHANTPEEAGTFSLAGAPAYSNNLTIDGLDNNDDRSARERFQP
jgi:hypothetical protein